MWEASEKVTSHQLFRVVIYFGEKYTKIHYNHSTMDPCVMRIKDLWNILLRMLAETCNRSSVETVALHYSLGTWQQTMQLVFAGICYTYFRYQLINCVFSSDLVLRCTLVHAACRKARIRHRLSARVSQEWHISQLMNPIYHPSLSS